MRTLASCLMAAIVLAATVAVAPAQQAWEQSAPATPLASDDLVELPNHVITVLSQAQLIDSPAGAEDQPVTITIVLNYADPAGFDAFLQSINSQPAASRTFLTPTEIADRFGPTQASYDAVLGYLQSYGFVLGEGSANRLTLTINGTRGQAELAFNLAIKDYQLGDQLFFANDANPRVPSAISGSIQAVVGLSNLSQPGPRSGVTTEQR